MTVLRTNVPIYFNAVNLFKCQFSKDPLKFLTDEMVSSFQQGRIPDIEYFIDQKLKNPTNLCSYGHMLPAFEYIKLVDQGSGETERETRYRLQSNMLPF